jgi:hypothetical protein
MPSSCLNFGLMSGACGATGRLLCQLSYSFPSTTSQVTKTHGGGGMSLPLTLYSSKLQTVVCCKTKV